jgi:cytochrome c oxidase subunit III
MNWRIVQDVSALPDHGFDTRSPMWWGTIGFVATEGAAFAAAIGAYFYLMFVNPDWPMSDAPPALGPGTLSLAVLLFSLWPNHLASKYAHRHDKKGCQRALVMMSLLGILPLVIRAFEFQALGLRWDENAYGSIVWVILGLHTLHLITDLGDTLVLTALMFTRHGHGKRFSDVADNAFYWDFVVGSWVVLYLVIYWAPRL